MVKCTLHLPCEKIYLLSGSSRHAQKPFAPDRTVCVSVVTTLSHSALRITMCHYPRFTKRHTFSSAHPFHHVQASTYVGLINSTVLVHSHLARVPQDAAGLSPGGGCSQSATVQDREKVLLQPDWRWSTTLGKKKSDFKAQYSFCLFVLL